MDLLGLVNFILKYLIWILLVLLIGHSKYCVQYSQAEKPSQSQKTQAKLNFLLDP